VAYELSSLPAPEEEKEEEAKSTDRTNFTRQIAGTLGPKQDATQPYTNRSTPRRTQRSSSVDE